MKKGGGGSVTGMRLFQPKIKIRAGQDGRGMDGGGGVEGRREGRGNWSWIQKSGKCRREWRSRLGEGKGVGVGWGEGKGGDRSIDRRQVSCAP